MRGPAAEAAAELIQSAASSSGDGSESIRRQLWREGEGAWEGAGAGEGQERRLTCATWDGGSRGSARSPVASRTGPPGLLAPPSQRVPDDPLATGVERIAAAVVLGTAATAAERARLRDAAARMASPRVRVAIERVADSAAGAADAGADDELAATMKSLAARDSAV